MKNLPLLLGTIAISLLMIVGIALMFSDSGSDTDITEVVSQTELISESPHVRGATESAQVTIVEFSDFQCPACRDSQPFVDQVLAQYPNDVQLIYRHFPLDSIHPNARTAAAAAEAAAEEGKFWEMHDLLFINQTEWERIASRDELNNVFAEYASQIQIDKNVFLEKIESNQVKEAVQEDSAAAARLGLNSTPTFFVNGQRTPAPQLMTAVESLVTESSED